MPDKQYYLISVHKMCTSPEADLVGKWSGVVAEEDLANLELPPAAQAAGFAFKDCPIKGIRPMTAAEIASWRDSDG